jgi:murein DD-endopeptidase MepM/ murein hydrolase activator NlpD
MVLAFPVQTGISARNFGDQRIYNQGLASWYHRGIDIRAAEGEPVLAAGDGKVLLVREFQANGNTILIDHGFGVTSCYLHQRAMRVKPGDYVRQGQVIGEVGHTGASLGNHLHFQINVNGVPVEPSEFFLARTRTVAKSHGLTGVRRIN